MYSRAATNHAQRDFGGDYASIPPHGRWQHFEVGGRPRVTQLLQSWPTSVDNQERTRRLIDLFLVSVLLDAGAGTKWSYKSKESGKTYSRSEGLAVASLEMFKAGAFSSDPSQPHQVDATGLSKVTVETLARGLQVSDANPMSGLEGRAGLLIRLGSALKNAEIFGVDGRPGNMIGKCASSPSFTKLNSPRLLDITSHNPSRLRSGYFIANSLECTYGRTLEYLACHPNQHSRCTTGRRLAVSSYAQVSSSPALGEHCAFPQVDAMAVLFPHGPDDQIAQRTLCWG